MLDRKQPVAICCGRPITRDEVAQIQETVSLFGNLSRKELTHTICEHLDWRTPSGTNKWDACLKMLLSFEKKGYITLPPKKTRPATRPKTLTFSVATDPANPVNCPLSDLSPVTLEPVQTPDRVKLWNEYTARHHYLGYKKPFGYHLRYFINSGDIPLGCLMFSGAAKALTARDGWIGWTASQRLHRLPWVINNSRFLIFPWVTVKNLASHVLGKVGRGIAHDWKKRWGFSPVLMETFVDPKFYTGSSYLGANWTYLGMTTGKGLVRKGKTYNTSPKKILVYPLAKNFKETLCRPLTRPAEGEGDRPNRLLTTKTKDIRNRKEEE